MRIFLVGDYYSGTGPANVTKYYIKYLPEGTLYQKCRNKAARAIELFWKILLCDVVCLSGYSRQNILALKLAKVFHKPSAYLMHGCVEYENSINHQEDAEMIRVERQTIRLSDSVFAVSRSFCTWLQGFYPEYAEKFTFVTNAIDDSLITASERVNEVSVRKEGNSGNSYQIFSIGGGMPRKQIKYICQAVRILQDTFDKNIKLVVVGDRGADTDEINSYDFVVNEGIVPFSRVVELFALSDLFVQNSCFETFGLATVEAIAAGCSALSSKEVGCLELIHNIREEDIIEHFDNPQEIAKRIRFLLDNPNYEYLLSNIDWESNTWKERSLVLVKKLQMLIK